MDKTDTLPRDAQSILELAARSMFELFANASEGMLLVDMYDQWRGQEQQESGLGALEDPRLQRARNWWDKLRG